MKTLLKSFAIALVFFTLSCTKDKKINVFTIGDDIKLGGQLDNEIRTNKTEYPILDSATNVEVYKYLYGMRDDILSSDLMFHTKDFNWRVTVINKDILNAFAAPGGKIYIYTGLMKYVKSGSELAGVLAHEIAHADRRHSTQQMTKVYGIQILFNIALGTDTAGLSKMAKDMATGAAALKWSRNHEYEADSLAVDFLYSVRNRKNYQCDALMHFFKRMDSTKTVNVVPEWLQTHPLDENRIARVNGHYISLGSPKGDLFTTDYANIIAKLPK